MCLGDIVNIHFVAMGMGRLLCNSDQDLAEKGVLMPTWFALCVL